MCNDMRDSSSRKSSRERMSSAGGENSNSSFGSEKAGEKDSETTSKSGGCGCSRSY